MSHLRRTTRPRRCRPRALAWSGYARACGMAPRPGMAQRIGSLRDDADRGSKRTVKLHKLVPVFDQIEQSSHFENSNDTARRRSEAAQEAAQAAIVAYGDGNLTTRRRSEAARSRECRFTAMTMTVAPI